MAPKTDPIIKLRNFLLRKVDDLRKVVEANAEASVGSYMVPIYAQRSGGLNTSTYEWAFGDAGATPSGAGVPILVPPGFKCEFYAAGMSSSVAASSGASVRFDVSGVPIWNYTRLTTGESNHVWRFGDTLTELSDGDVLNCYTQSNGGITSGVCTVVAWLLFTPVSS